MIKSHCINGLVLAFVMTLVSPATSLAAQQQSYQEWLEQYGAWDRLENQIAKEDQNESPETILKRAEVYLNLNSPQKTLEIIEMTPAFADNATEAERLWLGGQALRAMGDVLKAGLWFTQASTYITNPAELVRKFKAEPELDVMWQDIWLKMYWSYASNFTLSRFSQENALNQVWTIGNTVWGDSFWEKVNTATSVAPQGQQLPSPAANADGATAGPFISNADAEAIARSLAAASLEKFEEAQQYVAAVRQPIVRSFWASLLTFLQNGATPQDMSLYVDGNYLKAQAFWTGNMLASFSNSRAQWLLGNPDSGPWTQFRNNLLGMPVDEATKAINNELGSMLISDQTANLLNNLKLAISIENGDFTHTATTWNSINKRTLPVALQLAGLVLFKDDLKNILPEMPTESFKLYPILHSLSSAAGYDLRTSTEAPFWTQITQSSLSSLSKDRWPADKLLRLAAWKQQFDQKPSMDIAKRAAFLFDDTSFGIESMLYLADQAVQSKDLQLGAFYLNRLDLASLPNENKVTWLDIKTRLELESARPEAAIKTYNEMAALTPKVPVMTRLRMALLYQQRREFKVAKTELMALWNMRAELTTALQAETLFWLGEGEQAVQNTDEALDYYLKLAWEYPQENIWALTGMYRASLIYEKRGNYATAKNLLSTVIKRADRKEQREAAQARIAAIDKKMGKSPSKDSEVVYPF